MLFDTVCANMQTPVHDWVSEDHLSQFIAISALAGQISSCKPETQDKWAWASDTGWHMLTLKHILRLMPIAELLLQFLFNW